MALHSEINPSDLDLLLGTGLNALEVATGLLTRRSGGVWIDTGDGGGILAGGGASDGVNRVDKDGVQLPLVDTSGIDKAAQDARKAAADAAAKADEAVRRGEQIRQDAQAGIDDARRQAQAAAVKADKVRTDLTQQVQNVKSEMDSAVEAAQTSANKAQSAADAAQKAADKANASTAGLDKTVQAVDAKAVAAKQAAAEAQSKAENVASDLDSANAVIERHTTELGELTTKVTNAVKKSDSALSVSTEAKQTATEASTTATSAYTDSQTALTQSTTASQTATAAKTTAESASKTANDSLKQSSSAVQMANQISTTLRTEYQTKADADRIYATQSSLKQTSDSITASVSKTYATKESLSALKNAADNAIESWRGTGVPTLTNKPAVDWTTDADKKKHSGDLYYDKATGKAYRFGSDDGETYTWELNQDTDVTKALADASKAQTSANNAQNSANAANTAAGKAQSTANTAVSNAATAKNTADAAQSSANKAQGDVDKLKVDIPATYATKSSLTQTAESITANVEAVKTTADSAVTAASKAQQTADGISANLSKNYQTKSQADTIYATKASLKATSDSISAEVTKAQGTADGAVTAASKAQQTADAVTLNLSKNYQTKAQNDAVYATQTSLKATSDSLSANITANAKTAQSAVDKATNLEANLNGFKSTVSQTYATKTDFNNLTIGGTNLLKKTSPKWSDWITITPNIANFCVNIGSYTTEDGLVPDAWYSSQIELEFADVTSTEGHEAVAWSQGSVDNGWTGIFNPFTESLLPLTAIRNTVYSLKHSNKARNTNAKNKKFNFQIRCDYFASGKIRYRKAKWEVSSKPTDWSPAPEDLQPAGDYATNSSLTQTANSIKAQVTEVSKTANGAMSKATTVEQTANGLSSKITEQGKTLDATVKTANEAKSTADSNKTTISQVSTTASNALSKASTVEQNLNGFKSTVSQTYGHGSNLWVNPTFDADKPQITTRVNNVTAPNGSGVNLLANRDHHNTATAFPVIPGHIYVMTAHVKRIKGNLSLHAGIWYTEQTGGNAFDTYVNAESTSDLSDGWMAATWRFTCPNGKSRGCVFFQIDNWPPDNGSTQWYVANVVCVDVTGLQPAGDYATNSSLTQTANQIRGEVSEKYQSKNGMSSYATTSALMQKADEITGKVTEVAKTAQGNTTTISQVSQKVDRINTTLSQQIGGKADTSRVSSLEQNLDGFKTSVAKTYQTKGDYPTKTEVQSRIDQSASSIKSTVGQTYTTLAATEELRKSTSRMFTLGWADGTGPKWVKLGYLTSNGDSSSVLLHVYSGDGYNGAASQNAEFEIFVKDGWQPAASAQGAFGVSVNRIRDADGVKVKVLAFDDRHCDIWAYLPWDFWNGHYTFQGDYKAWQDGPNCGGERIQDNEPTNGVAQDLAYDTLSTRSYVDQTSKSVALGVVQDYRGADGSGLATKSDITVAKDGITSTVASTYATKSGVTQEISSKITQNNNSLDVRFATKAENQTVRDAANTAKSDASDARSRVGALEDCISLTSDGVRVGKRSNGVFTGPSTMVGTDGAFHVLDRGSNGHDEDVAKLGHDLLAIKSKLELSDGSHLDRLTAGPYGDNHFAIRMNPAAAIFDNHESVQIWQTGWQTITTGNGCEGYASYGYRGGCLRFRGRVRTTVDGDNSLFADPDLLNLPTTPVNRNYLLPAYRNGTLGWTNTYVPANTRQVKIYGVWDWVSLDQLSIAQ